jgi:hypothetical protein
MLSMTERGCKFVKITKTPQELHNDLLNIVKFLLAGQDMTSVDLSLLMEAAFGLEVLALSRPNGSVTELFAAVHKDSQVPGSVDTIFGLTNEDIEKGSNELRTFLSKACLEGKLGPDMQGAFLAGLNMGSGAVN